MMSTNRCRTYEVRKPPHTLPANQQNAVRLLRSRMRAKRPDATAAKPDSLTVTKFPNGRPQFKGLPQIEGMKKWLEALGNPHNGLKVIHVAGTKGKGSTAAWTEALLRGRSLKTGLYTSPHLIDVNERIRLDFSPVDKALFAECFFHVYDTLNLGNAPDTQPPRYLQLLTLVMFCVFARSKADVVIMETHHGGRFDATNVVEPVVTAITPIGMDHVVDLGPTLENIAYHKAGIMKHNVPVLSSPQDDAVAKVLEEQARESGADLTYVDPSDASFADVRPDEAQRANCCLAVRISNAFLAAEGKPPLSKEDIRMGVQRFFWPGRFQVIEREKRSYFIDGAHNDMSISKAASWFVERSEKAAGDAVRIVVFSQTGAYRDSIELLRCLLESLPRNVVDTVILTTKSRTNASEEDDALLKGQHALCQEKEIPATIVANFDHVPAAINDAAGPRAAHVFVTGSLYLVGVMLEDLQASTS